MSLLLDVALFIRSEESQKFDLIPSDVSILMIIASHIGKNAEWLISVDKIAKECRLKQSQFSKRSNRLKKLQLLSIRRTGYQNAYGIILPNKSSINTHSDMHSSADLINPDMHSSADQICALVHNGAAPECSSLYINKHKANNKEKERGKISLPVDFLPDQKIVTKAAGMGLTELEINTEFEKFMDLHTESDRKEKDWNKPLNLWFIRAAEFKRKLA